jgi:hypothetical protein
MNRRGFMGAILAAATAPAIVKAMNLMPVKVLESGLLVPDVGLSLAEQPELGYFFSRSDPLAQRPWIKLGGEWVPLTEEGAWDRARSRA